VYWKYKSASSTLWALMALKALAKWVSSKPKGSSNKDLAVARRSSVGSREIMLPL
jgi:hypothetical protein